MDRVKKMPFQETNEQAQASSTSSSSPPASFRQKGRRKKRDNPKEPQRATHKLRSPKSDSSEGDSTTTTTANNSVDSETPGSPGIPASGGREEERAMSSSPTPGVPQRLQCSYCNVYFITKADLQTHCRSQDHQTTIMSDEGRDWSHRPPPRGLGAEDYTLCPTYRAAYTCRMGDQCVEAHSEAELAEWQERFEYRAMKLERAREKQLHGASYADLLLERLSLTQQQDALITEKTDRIISHLSPEPNLRVSHKPSSHEWVITLQPPTPLRVVSLLHDAHRNHFTIAEVTYLDAHRHLHWSCVPENPQEWSSTEQDHQAGPDIKYKVTISFRTAIYGTFRQAVVFDFGSEPVAMQRLCVDVVPVEDIGALEETKRTILTRSERWCEENVDIVPFDSKPHELSPDDRGILAAYPPPTNENFVFTQTSMERFPTKTNYRSRMHDLLNIEELAQFDLVSRFNIKTTLQITSGYMLLPSTVSTAKYSRPGELFGKLELSSEISEDSHHGRLVLSNCNSMLVASTITPSSDSERGGETPKARRCIYEVLIEDKTKKEIYLRFSEQSVAALNFTEDEEATVEVQFQLNRLPLCEMHAALDRLPSLDMIFPDVTMEPTIPWSPIKQWGETLDAKLNPKQKEALVAITAPYGLILPPILIIGPYGTGKTHTLAQGIKQILRQPETRILICTHSNSAADLYIKDYLHPYVKAGHEEARPLRIYYRNRWVTTVHPDVQEYCLIETDVNVRRFVTPTEEQILAHRVIVATLNTSRIIASLKLEKGVFTHILIDEAAQAMECETLMPLALAKPDTRLVLAGDYMQLSPEVFSPYCEERGLGTSLLERLYDLYPADSPCKIMLVENYRSHSAIIKYTSDLFYEGRLVASGKQMAHPKFYPLTFFTARGEDFQDPSSTAFHNNSEVYEVCEQVGEIINYWPKSEWGPVGESSIGVVTPYADQMVRIRAELRKRKLYKISVERVLNVQGKQFRVIILSTVRTRHTCKTGDEGLDFGFLSNAKLLTTAITRAQSLVAVVGDPVSLCSVGKCRKLWERFLQLCSEAGSLYGITWSALRAQLDGVELKKTYGLNPLAPEFVPRYIYYPSLPSLSIVSAVPPYINILPSYSSFIPANYPVHPMVGPQALPYVPHGSPLAPHWSPMPYGPMPKHQIVRPAPARLGQPLIAASHPLRQVAATTAPPGPFLEASGYGYSLPHGVMPVYPYQSGGGPRLPVVRRPTDLDSVGRNLFMTALPAHYHHLKQAGGPSSLLGSQSGLRGPRFPNALQLQPTQRQMRLPTQTEGEKTFQFLNNVHFPERQMTPNPSPLIRLPQSHVESESPMSTQSWESSHSSGNDGGPGGRLHGPPAPPSPATPSHLATNLPDSHPHHLHTSHPQLHSHPLPHPLHQPHPHPHSHSHSHSHPHPPHQPHLQPQPHPLPLSHPHPHPHPLPHPHPHSHPHHPHPHHPQMPPHRDLAPPILPPHLQHQHPPAPQQPVPQRPQLQSNGRVAGEDHAPDVPDVVRAIDELIGDLPPSKPASLVPFESDIPESRGEARVSSPPIDSWLNNMSVRPSPRLAPPPIGPWSTSSPSPAAKIDVGKMVTVQELEASLHGRQQNHVPGLAAPVLSLAPGGPLGNSRDLERVLGVSRDSERLLGEADNNSQVKGPGTGVPPPPGFGGFNSLVDPVSRLDISESVPGYRTPSLPLYLRRGSKETSSRSLSSVGEPPDHALWSLGAENLRMSTSTHGELGLKNMAHSIDNLGLTGSLGLDRRDSKTYAGVLRSSLQTPAAGVEVSKCEESVFSPKELGNKKVHPGNSPLYQYFP